MSEKEPPDSLSELDARLRRFREKTAEKSGLNGSTPQGSMSGLGIAMRLGTELVAALIVGVGIGYGLDRWLGTAPWFMVVFFFLGSGAGILNVYRMASGLGVDPTAARNENTDTIARDKADDDNQR